MAQVPTEKRPIEWYQAGAVVGIVIGLVLTVWVASERFTRLEQTLARVQADVAEVKETVNEIAPRRVRSAGSSMSALGLP